MRGRSRDSEEGSEVRKGIRKNGRGSFGGAAMSGIRMGPS